MAEYIDREEALAFPFANGHYDSKNAISIFILGCESYREYLESIPAADVAPVVRGKWIESDLDKDCVTCSNCKRLKLNGRYAFTKLAFEDWGLKFCPNCGARMDGNTDDKM